MGDPRRLLGNRIRNRRIRLSFTQRELAEEAGFSSAQIISQIEKGERDVKAWELFNLAKVLRVEIPQLLVAKPRIIAPQVFWRKSPEHNKELHEADFLHRCNQYAFLEKLCDMPIESKIPVKQADLTTMNFNEARQLGEETREELGLGNRPGAGLISMLEQSYGVKVWYKDMGIDGSAASTKGPFGVAVLLNSYEAPWRRNFSFAHELFHLITWDSVDSSLIVDGQFIDNVEKVASAFASSLLLPAEKLLQSLKTRVVNNILSHVDFIDIAREFDVSTDALLWRMYNLGVIKQHIVYKLLEDADFKEADREFRVGQWGLPPELPERYVRLAFMAYQLGKLSRTKLAELINTSLIDLTDRLLEYGLDDRKNYQAPVHTIRC